MRAKIPLKNGCWRTPLQVTPQNWHTAKSSMRKNWAIWYRYTDPSFIDQYPDGKLVSIKGMNHLKDRKLRQELTKHLIETETRHLDENHFNPCTNTYMVDPDIALNEITPATGMMDALEWGRLHADISPSTRDDIKSVLTYVRMAAVRLQLSNASISTITRRRIMLLLDTVGKIKKNHVLQFKNGKTRKGVWTPNNFNHYLKNLGIVFSYLDQYQLFESIPTDGIHRKKVPQKKEDERPVVSFEDVQRVFTQLNGRNYPFKRFLRIFQKSGARPGELLNVKYSDVHLERRQVGVWINKRDEPTYEMKEIEPEVLSLWQEIMTEAEAIKKDSSEEPLFLFSVGLRPAHREKPLREEQVSRRWRRHCKLKLGIEADMYTLRHNETTKEVDRAIEEMIEKAHRKAAKKNGHTSTAMERAVYDTKSAKRKSEIKKKLRARRLLFRI